jgi:hypothetical protein
MNQLKLTLINKAKSKHENIFPVGSFNDLFECFTTEGNLLLFWYNTKDLSTHLETCDINI